MRTVLQILGGVLGLATLVFAGLFIWFAYRAALTPGPNPTATDAGAVSILAAFIAAFLGGAAFGLAEDAL